MRWLSIIALIINQVRFNFDVFFSPRFLRFLASFISFVCFRYENVVQTFHSIVCHIFCYPFYFCFVCRRLLSRLLFILFYGPKSFLKAIKNTNSTGFVRVTEFWQIDIIERFYSHSFCPLFICLGKRATNINLKNKTKRKRVFFFILPLFALYIVFDLFHAFFVTGFMVTPV